MRVSIICILILATLAPVSGLDPDRDRCMINVDLPARTVQDVVVTDRLPCGLIYRNDSLNITGGYGFQEYVDGPNDGREGQSIKWSFGNVNNSDNRDLEIDFLAVVADASGNRAGVTLHPSRASLQWRDAMGLHFSSDEAAPVEIVEPDLSIEEETSPLSCRIGDNVSCKISIYHSAGSSSYAFDADLTLLLPPGLAYIPGSMEILSGPAAALDDSNPSAPVQHFESVDSSWTRSCPIVLRYNATANVAGRQCIESLLRWTSAKGCSPYERSYSSEGRACLDVEDRRSGLFISKSAPGRICPGCILNYTISYENSGEAVHRAFVNEFYDANTTFLSANPMPDAGTNDLWTIGDIPQGGSGKTDVSVMVMSGVKDGTELNNTAMISSDNSKAAATARTIVRSRRPALEIYKRQNSDVIRPGDSISYTIFFANDGPGEAENVSVTDIVDSHLRVSRSDPPPAKIWSDGAGTHLLWDASALNTSGMIQGQQGRIELAADLPPVPEHPDTDTVYNSYRIDSDSAEGASGSLETFVVHSLFVRKEADRDACAPHEILNYTITYGNDLSVEAKDAAVTDSLEGADLVYASTSPEVEGGKLIWRLGTLKAHSEGTIRLTVMVRERPEIRLQEKQLVSGVGYVSSSRRLYASKEPDELVNRVEITASYSGKAESDSSISRVRILQYPGAEMESIVKGSGDIDSVQSMEYNRNRNLSFDKRIRARYSPANISISGGSRTMTISSLFEDRTRAANRARNEALQEDYRYVSLLDHEASFFLDENQTAFSSSSEFDSGEAEVGYQRHAPDGNSTMEVSEDYRGSFRLENRLDSYGSDTAYTRSASGRGFVSSNERSAAAGGGSEVRSYERGSGLYSTEETVASDPAICKYVNLSYAEESWSSGSLRAPYSSKWSEGMAAEDSGRKSTISERIGYADLVKKDAVMGSSSLAMSGEFSGVGSLEMSAWNGSNEEMAIDEMFAGRYVLDASLYMSGLQRFLGPHISITKKAVRLEARTVLFRINVTNDGNKTLAPVEIVDDLPENVRFINSSLRPIINGRNISWWIVSLQPGDTRTIDLRAGLNGSAGNNRARAEGHYRNEIVKAEASCGVIPQKPADLPGPGSACQGSCPLVTYTDVGEDICSCGCDRDYYDYGYYYEALGENEALCGSCV